MHLKGDTWSWAFAFSGIELFYAFTAARWCVEFALASGRACEGQNIASGIVGFFALVHAGAICFVVSALYSLAARRSEPFLGSLMAAALAVPLMVAATILMFLTLGLFHLVGFKTPPFNPYYFRLILPVILLVIAFVRKPKTAASKPKVSPSERATDSLAEPPALPGQSTD